MARLKDFEIVYTLHSSFLHNNVVSLWQQCKVIYNGSMNFPTVREWWIQPWVVLLHIINNIYITNLYQSFCYSTKFNTHIPKCSKIEENCRFYYNHNLQITLAYIFRQTFINVNILKHLNRWTIIIVFKWTDKKRISLQLAYINLLSIEILWIPKWLFCQIWYHIIYFVPT